MENIFEKHINNGVIFRSFENVHIDDSVIIGEGTEIFPGQNIYGNSVIGKNCKLLPNNTIINSTIQNDVKIENSVICDSIIQRRSTIGPFAHVHSKSIVGKFCRVGNFVEIKNSRVGDNTKTAHLSYIGDADIGDYCNIGCGSIFVNYDGNKKQRSVVGNSVFIGSNCNIIAPVKVSNNAYIACGTTLTVDLKRDCLCIGRARETIKENKSKYYKSAPQKKYFGTDGIRGVYGDFLTNEMSYVVGNYLGYNSQSKCVVVGYDTRISGISIFENIAKGIVDSGCDVINLGVCSSPMVSFATTMLNATYGVSITASHNPCEYNGIKIFTKDGNKLGDTEEVEIEDNINNECVFKSAFKGVIRNGEKYKIKYIENIKNICGDLSDFRIGVDTANGALSFIAGNVFRELGAEVFAINDEGDGNKINENSGALHPEILSRNVVENKLDIAFAFDGDADRIVAIDERGNIVDGDKILYVIAKFLKVKNKLNNDIVIGTIFSNKALENELGNEGITFIRTDVGDHNIQREMSTLNGVLGGENSGHIIIKEFSNTGDGLLSAIYILHIMKEVKKSLYELSNIKLYSQIIENIATTKKCEIATNHDVNKYINDIKSSYCVDIRIILRPSGTEDKLRILVECQDEIIAKEVSKKIKFYIENL